MGYHGQLFQKLLRPLCNEVKCSLTELTTRSDCSQLLSVVLLYLHLCWIPCALSSLFIGMAWRRSISCGAFYSIFFFRRFLPLATFLCLSVWQVPVFAGAWGLMAGSPGFASHRCNLHLGAGCQSWKLQDVSVTQPPLSSAVVNLL